MAQALYRKYRSKSLSEIIGQQHVTDILARALKTEKIAHAYLLTGPRGVGKTSIARILAHEINKLPYTEASNHLDIIEIDAASNNGVEDVRALRDKVQVAPVSANKKIYIIDEVHMLSKPAFNALLKTLEEPPEHAVFILATTDLDKLPATIVSRTQRFSLKLVAVAEVMAHLKTIAANEKIAINDDALRLIAQRGEGSFRDSISLLDQLRSLVGSKDMITKELIEQSLGLAPEDVVVALLAAYDAHDLKTIVSLLDTADTNGIQTTMLTDQLIEHIRTHVVDSPQHLPLLDQLLEVKKSALPSIKLLTVLAADTTPKPKHAALHASLPQVSAPIKELERQATKLRPAAPKRPVVPAFAPPKEPEPQKAKKTGRITDISTFDWSKLIEHTRQNYVAIYSLLTKCSHVITPDTLTLYTGSAFYKKRLDDNKHRVNLATSLKALGFDALMIETIGTPPPPKDSVAASVAAIMGGGEEVSVEP